jgi:hypothetical protein
MLTVDDRVTERERGGLREETGSLVGAEPAVSLAEVVFVELRQPVQPA